MKLALRVTLWLATHSGYSSPALLGSWSFALACASIALLGAACGGGGGSSQLQAGMLAVAEVGGMSSSGVVGGPFSPSSVSYTLFNTGSVTLQWTATQTQAWMSLSKTGGSLSGGASDTVIVSLDPQANSLATGSYSGTITFTDTTIGSGETTRSFSLSVSSTPGQAMNTASRTSGVAPLSVFFDAVGNGSSVIQPTGATPDYASFLHRWTFADPASGTWSINGKRKNFAIGYVAAHVFEKPGSYHVTLQVTDANGEVQDYYQDITVLDPDVVYAGKTYYVSSSTGNDASNGLSPSTPFKSVSKAMSTLFASDGPRRVAFHRGETWTASAEVSVSGRTGPFTIGAFGTGANPVIRVTHSNAGIYLDPSVSDVRIMDIDFTGPSPALAGEGVQLGRDSLLLRSRVSGFDTGVGGHSPNCIANTVAECSLVDNSHYGMYYAPGYDPTRTNDPPIHLAVLGNRFDNSGNSLLRTYASRSLWQSNVFLRAGNSTARLLGIHTPKKAEFDIIADNTFDSVQIWVLEIGPENDENGGTGGVPQVVENVIVEGNKFFAHGVVSRLVLIWGRYVTVRNNIFDQTGAAWGGTIFVAPRGIGPVPVGVRIDNNTAYRGDAAPTFVFVEATSQDLTLVRNNIVYSPEVSATVASGTVTEQDNLDSDPLFDATAGGDFHVQLGSSAIDQGLAVPVRSDYEGNNRPLRSGHDIGAFERP